MPFRISDVATQAGVSKSTVSRVFNQSRLVNPETRQRVLEAARELDYHPSASAKQLARGGQSDFFGLLISDIANPVFPEIIKGFETAAEAKGFNLFLCTTDYHAERAGAAIRKMIENGVRGVAIMTSSLTEQAAAPLAARDIPVVMLDLLQTRTHISSIAIDYGKGVSESIEHLAQLGHKLVTFLAGPDDRRSSRRYREAVIKALSAHGMRLQQIVECDHTLEGGRAAVWKLATATPAPTALVCVNDMTAIGAILALREMGINVPGQVSVLGCEDIFLTRFVDPPLTTIRFDRKCLGRMAFDTLERMSKSKARKGTRERLETTLIVRSSTATRNSHLRSWGRVHGERSSG